MSKKIFTIVGARPQFVKAAPVSHALLQARLDEVLVHTGQHFDPLMSDVFFDELEIPKPKYNLEINSLSHGAMTGRMVESLETLMLEEAPSLVLIYGDTNSTLAGALAAAKLNIPVAHVEAGLRSFNRKMPEEINRVIADHVSSLLLCPTQTAVHNLKNEGIHKGVFAVGDVMYDATLTAIAKARNQSKILSRLSLLPKSYAVATIHRAENTGTQKRFEEIVRHLIEASSRHPIIMPVHPRTRKLFDSVADIPESIRLIDPLGYLDMAQLVHHSTMIYTDSGGLQKEAYFHGVLCETLRDETEWVETVEAGWNKLWTETNFQERQDIADYGNGDASKKIVEVIQQYLGR